jgi:hypothetical protein
MTGAGVGAALTAATAAGVMAGVNLSLGQAPVGEDESLLTALYDTGLADDLGGSS